MFKTYNPNPWKQCFIWWETSIFLGQGYQLFVDNWYTSPSLLCVLQAHGTNVVRTAELNRKYMPKDLTVRALAWKVSKLVIRWKATTRRLAGPRYGTGIYSSFLTWSSSTSRPSIVLWAERIRRIADAIGKDYLLQRGRPTSSDSTVSLRTLMAERGDTFSVWGRVARGP